MSANTNIIAKMAGSGRRNRRGGTLICHRKTGRLTLDLPKKMKTAPKVRTRQSIYPMRSSKWNTERIQPAATDQEETNTQTAARCKVETFLTATFIAEYFRENQPDCRAHPGLVLQPYSNRHCRVE